VALSNSGNPVYALHGRNGVYSVCAGAASQTCEYSVYGSYDYHHGGVFYASLLPSLHLLCE
jgi:hypothetical protein